MLLTASSTILPLLVLGISFTTITLVGTCLGDTFFLICDFILCSKFSDNEYFLFITTKRIKIQIKKNASPRHVPSKVIVVNDIPRTKSGKIVELAVKNTIEGNKIKNKEALANPEALKYFKNLKELSN